MQDMQAIMAVLNEIKDMMEEMMVAPLKPKEKPKADEPAEMTVEIEAKPEPKADEDELADDDAAALMDMYGSMEDDKAE